MEKKTELALRFELRTNRFAICCATTAPYELFMLCYLEKNSGIHVYQGYIANET